MEMLVSPYITNTSTKPVNPALPKAVSGVSVPPQAVTQTDLVERNPLEEGIKSNLFNEPEKNDIITQFTNSIFGRTVTDYSSLARQIVAQQSSLPKSEKTQSQKTNTVQERGNGQTSLLNPLNSGSERLTSALLESNRTVKSESTRTLYASDEQRAGITSYQRTEAGTSNANPPAIFQLLV